MRNAIDGKPDGDEDSRSYLSEEQQRSRPKMGPGAYEPGLSPYRWKYVCIDMEPIAQKVICRW